VVTVPAEIIVTPMGPKAVGEQRELISQVAKSAADEAKLVAAGWHLHPADAVRAAGGEAPTKGADQTIAELQAQIAKLQLQVNNRGAEQLAAQRTTGALVGRRVPPVVQQSSVGTPDAAD
jgi:hypothetical protein